MTEPVPGQTPDPAVADDATATPPTADEREPRPTETADTTDPAATTDAAGPADTGSTTGPAGAADAAGGGPAVDPQELFGSLSLSAIEADIDRLMSDKMSELDGMLAGLEELVQRLEGEITNLEPPPDDRGGA